MKHQVGRGINIGSKREVSQANQRWFQWIITRPLSYPMILHPCILFHKWYISESENNREMLLFLIPITTVEYILFLLSKFTLQVRQQIDRRKKRKIPHQPISYLPESLWKPPIERKFGKKQRFSTLTVILYEFHKFSNTRRAEERARQELREEEEWGWIPYTTTNKEKPCTYLPQLT